LLLPTLADQLLYERNAELITAKLQQTRSQRPTPAPTPDSSMILPPKPEQQDDDKQEQEGSAENMAEEKDESEKAKDDQEAVSTSTDGADGHSKEDSSDSTATSDINGDSHQSTQPSSAASEADKDETATAAQDEDAAKPESQEAVVETTPVAAEPQAIVKDEATAAIERKTKLELWNELKVMSFTRTVTALYSLTFLTLLTQVQLNLLGRFTYVSSVIALSNTTDASYRVDSPSVKGSLSSTAGQLDFQTEKKYLTFSYWLLHEGWRRWSEKVRDVVEDVVGG
jgi:peroxin-3